MWTNLSVRVRVRASLLIGQPGGSWRENTTSPPPAALNWPVQSIVVSVDRPILIRVKLVKVHLSVDTICPSVPIFFSFACASERMVDVLCTTVVVFFCLHHSPLLKIRCALLLRNPSSNKRCTSFTSKNRSSMLFIDIANMPGPNRGSPSSGSCVEQSASLIRLG